MDNKRGELVCRNIPLAGKAVSFGSRVEPVLSGADGLDWLCFVSFALRVRNIHPASPFDRKNETNTNHNNHSCAIDGVRGVAVDNQSTGHRN